MDNIVSKPTQTANKEKKIIAERLKNKWLWPKIFAALNNASATDQLDWSKSKDTRDKYKSLRKVYTAAYGLPLYPTRPAGILQVSPAVSALRRELASEVAEESPRGP